MIITNSTLNDIPEIFRLYKLATDFQKIKFPANQWPEFDKEFITNENVVEKVISLMHEIQESLYKKAILHRAENTTEVSSYEEFKKVLDSKGGFILAHWDGTSETEEKIKTETKATIRCIPLDGKIEAGECMVTGKPSSRKVLFARAY